MMLMLNCGPVTVPVAKQKFDDYLKAKKYKTVTAAETYHWQRHLFDPEPDVYISASVRKLNGQEP